MKRYFLDTSALVKIYHREEGSDYCLELYSNHSHLIISELARVELHSAIYRKQREKQLNAKALKVVLQKFTMIARDAMRFSKLPHLFMMRRAACFPDMCPCMGSGHLTAFSLQHF